ncbi:MULTISPECIES: hypothetical protein [Bremerella]|uniref:hypothetical protein n=1 Tax=Bremerella TaxID=2714594 RepID=UPI0031F11286
MRELSLFIPFADWNESIRQQVETMADVLCALDLKGEVILLSLSADSQDTPRSLDQREGIRRVEIRRPRTYSSALFCGTQVAEGELVIHLPAELSIPGVVLQGMLQQLIQQDLVIVSTSQNHVSRMSVVSDWLTRRMGGAARLDVSRLVWGARREALVRLPQIQGLSRGLPLLVGMQGYRVAICPSNSIGGQPTESSPLPDCWSWKDWAGHRWLQQRWTQVDFSEASRSPDLIPDLRVAFFEDESRRKAG